MQESTLNNTIDYIYVSIQQIFSNSLSLERSNDQQAPKLYTQKERNLQVPISFVDYQEFGHYGAPTIYTTIAVKAVILFPKPKFLVAFTYITNCLFRHSSYKFSHSKHNRRLLSPSSLQSMALPMVVWFSSLRCPWHPPVSTQPCHQIIAKMLFYRGLRLFLYSKLASLSPSGR